MVVVESHHQVLEAWSSYRASLVQAPRVLTLDHHTDTSAPFRSLLRAYEPGDANRLRTEWLSRIDYKNMDSIHAALEKLDHDEHIVTAIKADIISSAFVVAQNAYDTGVDTYREHKIMCLSVADRDRVLESSFLNEMIESFDQSLLEVGEAPLLSDKYILDIDLDYLNTKKSVAPQNVSTLQRLVKNAGLVTIALEADHVQMCARESGVTSEYLLPRLLKLLQI